MYTNCHGTHSLFRLLSLVQKKALEYLETKFQNSLYQDNKIVSDDELAQVGFSRFNDNLAYQVKSGEYYMCGLAEY